MKLVYIAGQYSAENFSQVHDNIMRAERVSLILLRAGWAVHAPHLNTRHFETYEELIGYNHNKWLEMDFEILRRCDAIFMMRHFEQSKGSKMELEFAKKNNIPVFFETDGFPNPGQVNQRV